MPDPVDLLPAGSATPPTPRQPVHMALPRPPSSNAPQTLCAGDRPAARPFPPSGNPGLCFHGPETPRQAQGAVCSLALDCATIFLHVFTLESWPKPRAVTKENDKQREYARPRLLTQGGTGAPQGAANRRGAALRPQGLNRTSVRGRRFLISRLTPIF